MNIKFKKINKTIIKCNNCVRLVNFRKKISLIKRKQNLNEKYWGKPVPGFGEEKAKLLILGLAPAAHGGNRTGRSFTGDKSSEFLFRCLHNVGISSSPFSNSINDGLRLNETYITNFLKCVPPGDKPLNIELHNCSKHFDAEIINLERLRAIVALGKVAFDNCIKFYKKKYNLKLKTKFKHGKIYLLPGNIKIFACYHPSPRNVNTKLVSQKMMIDLFKKAKKISTI